MKDLFALGIMAASVLAGPAGAAIPPIDAAAPVKTETATFALG